LLSGLSLIAIDGTVGREAEPEEKRMKDSMLPRLLVQEVF
jgi:hypothetical protein